MKNQDVLKLTMVAPDDDWFLGQSTAAAGSATSFSHTYMPFGPAKIALKLDSATATTVTIKYYRADEDPEYEYEEDIEVDSADVYYTTYAATKLTSVAWTLVAGATLDVG